MKVHDLTETTEFVDVSVNCSNEHKTIVSSEFSGTWKVGCSQTTRMFQKNVGDTVVQLGFSMPKVSIHNGCPWQKLEL